MEDPINTQADTPLQSVLDQIVATLDGADSVDLKTVVEAFGDRSFGPIMVLCGLCMMTPLGAIPGIPPAFGLIVIIFALQLLFRRKTPWMPEVISLSFFPLGMIPFGVVAPAVIILLFGLGITARDGILILLGLSLSCEFNLIFSHCFIGGLC